MPVDPLDALRLPSRPLAPRPAFAAELRSRIERELLGPAAAVTPYLCAADALAAIEFYQQVFGAELTMGPLIGPDGRVGHSELRIGGSTVMLASTYPEELVIDPLEAGGTTVQLRLQVPDVDAVFARAVEAGATVLRDVADQPYGDRAGKIRDPFGHNWFIATVVEDLSAQQLNERMAPLGFTPAGSLESADPGQVDPDEPAPGY